MCEANCGLKINDVVCTKRQFSFAISLQGNKYVIVYLCNGIAGIQDIGCPEKFMFNLQSETQRIQQLKHDKIYGLPYKRKPKDPKIQHIDGNMFETDAQHEGAVMLRGFKNKSVDFGRRLSKAKGQRHYPGGYAG